MNLVLFERFELEHPLASDDRRAKHILQVLRRQENEDFDCGIIDGPRGKACIRRSLDDGRLDLRFVWEEREPPDLDPIALVVGLPRPQTARKILGEVTALGVARIDFFSSDRGEASYRDSSLWSSGEVRRLLVAGAEQAFCTRLPVVTVHPGLADAIASVLVWRPSCRVALDNYESTVALSKLEAGGGCAALAIGPEPGWSADERDRLRAAGFVMAGLGPRVLRTETACVAGLAILKARLGLI